METYIFVKTCDILFFSNPAPPFPSVRPQPNARKSSKPGQNLPRAIVCVEKSGEKQTAGILFNSQQTDHDKVRPAKNSELLPDEDWKCYCHQGRAAKNCFWSFIFFHCRDVMNKNLLFILSCILLDHFVKSHLWHQRFISSWFSKIKFKVGDITKVLKKLFHAIVWPVFWRDSIMPGRRNWPRKPVHFHQSQYFHRLQAEGEEWRL